MKDREQYIKKMPDKKTLEEFVKNLSGEEEEVKVVFNQETGEFEWLVERPKSEPPLGSPKTEYGRKLREL